VQLIMIGIMGEYIGKVLSEIKARPVYFVAEHSVRTAQGLTAQGLTDQGLTVQGLTDQGVTDQAGANAPARTAAE
jgi:hypothetical protein